MTAPDPQPTLADFLLARLADDEAMARGATQGDWTAEMYRHRVDLDVDGAWIFRSGADEVFATTMQEDDFQSRCGDARHIVNWGPTRVLADVAAKRQIVDSCSYLVRWNEALPGSVSTPGVTATDLAKQTLRLLAQPYADHSDYRSEWAR